MIVLAAIALGCASCGSGGDSPLILYPNESFKAYCGTTSQVELETVYPDGEIGKDLGPERKQVQTVAFGATFLTDFFATMTVPQITNRRGDEAETGMGDFAAEARWTAVPTSMIDPARPQIQAIAGYKAGTAPSIHDSEDTHQLDVFGTGYAETKAGVDIWWGSESWKVGFAEIIGIAEEKTIDGVETHPGNASRTTLTAGYGTAMGKVLLGSNLTYRGMRTADGEEIDDSETVDHGAYVTGDVMIGNTASVRLTFARSSAFGQNRNSVRSRSVTLAVMGAL